MQFMRRLLRALLAFFEHGARAFVIELRGKPPVLAPVVLVPAEVLCEPRPTIPQKGYFILSWNVHGQRSTMQTSMLDPAKSTLRQWRAVPGSRGEFYADGVLIDRWPAK